MAVAAEQFTRAPEPTLTSRVTVLAVIIIPLIAVLPRSPSHGTVGSPGWTSHWP